MTRPHGARSSQGSKTATGGECSALVLDCEHAVIGSTWQVRPLLFSADFRAIPSSPPLREHGHAKRPRVPPWQTRRIGSVALGNEPKQIYLDRFSSEASTGIIGPFGMHASLTAMLRSDLAERELRQSQLIYRLLCHEARTQTIRRFLSLSAHQITRYRHRWGFKEQDRSRGPSPNSFAPFFRSTRMRVEGGHLALICKTHELWSKDVGPRVFYTLDRAEQLCDALDAHRATFSQATLTFDQLVLLVRGLCASVSIRLGSCKSCGRPVLIDPLEPGKPGCNTCITTIEGCMTAPSAGLTAP
ncbi:hypothetical protein HNQ60_004526 [Povalibacter uvarum]|uniref:Uncharacterized protein n=1 Tax=Povalibacter uvarum TaxID=732238 RepID=A0A841HUY3_9GAMM|nr:hypothetical protein [Povalibacter uvarum]